MSSSESLLYLRSVRLYTTFAEVAKAITNILDGFWPFGQSGLHTPTTLDWFPKKRKKATRMILRTIFCLLLSAGWVVAADNAYDYRVLAPSKTSTMEKELNEAADAGFHFEQTMGGKSTFGGSEVVTVMAKEKGSSAKARYAYKLLATSKTSTMQKELQAAGDEGFAYKDQTVFGSSFGGDEVVVILELDRESASKIRYEYKLLATSKTSTMQKELQEAGDA